MPRHEIERSAATRSARGTDARQRLVEQTRALALAVGTTPVDDAVLEEVTAALAQVERRLAERTVDAVPGLSYAESVGRPTYDSARFNPAVPHVRLEFADGAVRGRVTLGVLHQGPRGAVHGGTVAHLLDTVLACLVQHEGRLCVTGSLEIRYLARSPLHRPLDLSARIESVEGRKVRVSGAVSHDGTVTAEATGLFIEIPDR